MDFQTNFIIEISGIALLLLISIFSTKFRLIFLFEPSVESSKKERSEAMDFVRGLAIFGVVAIHIDSFLGNFYPKSPEVLNTRLIANLSRYCVPAFILSSAIFLSWKGNLEFWKPKFQNLLLPYSIIFVAGYLIKLKPSEFSALDMIEKYFFGTSYAPYYYVPLLIQCYILYAVFFKKLDQFSKPAKLAILFISFLVNLASNQIHYPNTYFWKNFEPAFIANFIWFFVIGISLRGLLKNKEVWLNLGDKIYFLLTVGSILIYSIIIGYFTFKENISVSNHFLFYPVVCFILFNYLGMKLENSEGFLLKVFKFLVFLGRNSLAIFLIHPILLHLEHAFNPLFLGSFAFSWTLHIILNLSIPVGIWHGFQFLKNKIFPKKDHIPLG